MSLPAVIIYSDGSCSPNPGPGGWGAVIIPEKGRKRELSGKVGQTTNNRMELQAALEALRSLPCKSRVELYTDSKYVQNGITSWIQTWRKSGWVTTADKPVKNRDLWEALDQELEQHQVQWVWVKGHADNRHNIRADELAVAARGRKVLPLLDESAIHIFMGITWRQKSGVGSWSAVLRYRKYLKIIGDTVSDSSANRIHIQSATEALRTLKRRLPVHLYTSSGYLQEGATSWLAGWIQNGWLTREGKKVSNSREWQVLSDVLAETDVTFHVIEKAMPPCHSQGAKEIAVEWVQEFRKEYSDEAEDSVREIIP